MKTCCFKPVVNNAKGNRPQTAYKLTEDEEDLLFQTSQFGVGNPEVLQCTVWWDRYGRLQQGDIVVEDDPVMTSWGLKKKKSPQAPDEVSVIF